MNKIFNQSEISSRFTRWIVANGISEADLMSYLQIEKKTSFAKLKNGHSVLFKDKACWFIDNEPSAARWIVTGEGELPISTKNHAKKDSISIETLELVAKTLLVNIEGLQKNADDIKKEISDLEEQRDTLQQEVEGWLMTKNKQAEIDSDR